MKAQYDSDGNRICEDCLAHVRPDLYQMHDCPPWLRMLVRSKKALEPQKVTNYDLTKCPNCGGEADNGHDRCDPPNVYYCTKCQDEKD